jgi:hypothetical protein
MTTEPFAPVCRGCGPYCLNHADCVCECHTRRRWLVTSRIVNDGCEAHHSVFDAELQAQAWLLESMRRCPKRPERHEVRHR